MASEHTHRLSRRGILGSLIATIGLLVTPFRAFAQACRRFVATDQGPFYPKEEIPFAGDLLMNAASAGKPPGTVLHLVGRVLDDQCRPVPGAVVEIWQCDAGSQYRHPNAPKTKPLEPGFLYFGKVRVAPDGGYAFRTLRPAPYEYLGLKRAAHIHVRVKVNERVVGTTELYFHSPEDEARQKGDIVFLGRGPHRDELVLALMPAASERNRVLVPPEPGDMACEYDISLGPFTASPGS